MSKPWAHYRNSPVHIDTGCNCGWKRKERTMEKVMTKLFVYGTLKRGFGNNRLLEESAFIGADEAPGRVYDGFVPVATPGEPNEWIRGEVYEVDAETLRRVDRLEGHPDHYVRTPVTLRSGTEASIYYWPHDISWRGEPVQEWPTPNSKRARRAYVEGQ